MSDSLEREHADVAPVSPARTNLVWLVLVLATCATTWWLSKDALTATVSTVLMILIGAYKVRLVLLEFMGLRTAPLPWRLVGEGWVLAVTCAVVTLYLV